MNLVSDMLTRMRNGSLAGFKSVFVPFSKLNLSVLRALKLDGYVNNFAHPCSKAYMIEVHLKYDTRGVPVIRYVTAISKSSRRVYSGSKDFRPKEQYATQIVSTSQGVMSHTDARKRGIGGEILCEVAC